MNDGAVIHLYYCVKCDTWMAYGLSAYMLCCVGEKLSLSVVCGFSDEVQMPYAEADKKMMKKLFGNDSEEYSKNVAYLKFWLSEPVNLDNYVRWAKQVKQF